MPHVLSPRDLVSRPDIMDETVPHTTHFSNFVLVSGKISGEIVRMRNFHLAYLPRTFRA